MGFCGLLIVVIAALVESSVGRRIIGACDTAALVLGGASAVPLADACMKCTYVRLTDDCQQCLTNAASLPNTNYTEKASVADLCVAYVTLYERVSDDRAQKCMAAAKAFVGNVFESYTYCMDCAYADEKAKRRDLQRCYFCLQRTTRYGDALDCFQRANVTNPGAPVAAYLLPSLPYPTEALEPYFDNRTMSIHNTLHHGAAVKALNTVLAAPRAWSFRQLPLHQLLASLGNKRVAPDFTTRIRNNGGSHWNHAFFWSVLAPPGTTRLLDYPDLMSTIQGDFGSVDGLMAKFNTTATNRFGSGWAWVVFDTQCRSTSRPACKRLVVTSTPNQDNPLMEFADVMGIPILGLDVWEHAYYLKYQNRRADYINAFWSVVNWKQVYTNWRKAQEGMPYLVLPMRP